MYYFIISTLHGNKLRNRGKKNSFKKIVGELSLFGFEVFDAVST